VASEKSERLPSSAFAGEFSLSFVCVFPLRYLFPFQNRLHLHQFVKQRTVVDHRRSQIFSRDIARWRICSSNCTFAALPAVMGSHSAPPVLY
jgi:hypothetical protein